MATSPLPFGAPAPDPAAIDDIAAPYLVARTERDASADVSDRTWRDLEGDALFRALDHTRTPLGRQRLYAALREPASTDQRARIEAVATLCGESVDVRGALLTALAPLRGSGAYRLWQLLRADDLAAGWVRGAPVITLVLLLLLLSLPVAPSLLVAAIPLALVGLAVRLLGLSRIGTYIGPLRELAPVLRCAARLHTILARSTVPAEQRDALCTALQPPDVSLSSVARWARLVSPELVASNELLASLYEYLNLVFLLDINGLVFVNRSLTRHRRVMEELGRAIAIVDVGVSVASYRTTREWCRPSTDAASTTLRYEGLRHPVLTDGVPNDVCLDAGTGLLLTGANMSGKSTLLRAIGTNVLLARALNTCTARLAAVPCTDVFTSIGHADDLERGVSYFFAEAEAVATLLQQAASRRAVFLFDELFRGTNAAERLAASEMVLRTIVAGSASTGGQFVAIATHDLQLGDLLADCFVPAHLAVEMDGDELRFRYTLTSGPAHSRTALALLRRLGVPGALLDAAAARARQLERESPPSMVRPSESAVIFEG